jgi:hypothetical protein
MQYGVSMGLREEAVALVNCATCDAIPGEQCVYLPRPDLARSTRPTMRALYERAGTPMKVPHRARTRALINNRMAFEREKWREERDRVALQLPSIETMETIHAMRAFDVQEAEQMREWLRRNYGLFGLK